ncbi:MAG: cyclic nucleotide-binding domain-containing protein [bacterium]|nr:cyclic nucleotide-binding domain-containing protein [bacterium]
MGSVHDELRAAIFESISSERIETLCSQGRELAFEAGHVLFERGQDAEELLVLQEGIAELFSPVHIMGATRELTLESKRAGDVVAWSALVPPYRFTLSARCAGPCRLISLSREMLHEFFETDPAVGYRFMRNLAGVIGQRLQAMQAIWMHDLQASAIRRME